MYVAQENIGPFALATMFHYSGTRRPVAAGRTGYVPAPHAGYGFVYHNQWGRLSLENVLISGNDTDCGLGLGVACQSSGGFTQLRYAFNRKLFALGRYQGTQDPVNGFTREGVVLLGYGPTQNTRLTIEDDTSAHHAQHHQHHEHPVHDRLLMLAALLAVALAIDPVHSKAAFSVQHIFVERVTGTVPITGGSVVFQADSAIPESITAELDPAKISSGDRDRDASLVSSDFFNVKAFPTWTFASTKITPVSATSFGVDGTLTIHGVAAPEHLDVTVRGDGARRVYHVLGHIDRQVFHMPVTRLDPVIGKVIDVTLDIVLK